MSQRAQDIPATAPRVGRLAVDRKELAALLGVSERHLRNMQHDGTFGPQPLRLGRCVRYPVDDLRRWIEAGKKGGATQ